jgi:hypothetical protein
MDALVLERIVVEKGALPDARLGDRHGYLAQFELD